MRNLPATAIENASALPRPPKSSEAATGRRVVLGSRLLVSLFGLTWHGKSFVGPVEPVREACNDTAMQHWRPRVSDSFQDERSRAKTDNESDCKFYFGRRRISYTNFDELPRRASKADAERVSRHFLSNRWSWWSGQSGSLKRWKCPCHLRLWGAVGFLVTTASVSLHVSCYVLM